MSTEIVMVQVKVKATSVHGPFLSHPHAGSDANLLHELHGQIYMSYFYRLARPSSTRVLSACRHIEVAQSMSVNRPRNRQPRPPRNDQNSAAARPSRANNSNVPTTQHVVSGAAVSIVLKADQASGREVQGVVQDLLTRGNHPRGIKVRLQDGRVGRVQRMAANNSQAATGPSQIPVERVNGSQLAQDHQNLPESNGLEPPPRSLADFIPDSGSQEEPPLAMSDRASFKTATATCPICGVFEGDEAAVSHHVDEHLT